MKLKGIALVLLVATMLIVSAASAEACPVCGQCGCVCPPCPPPPCEEGKSPGYWKHECKVLLGLIGGRLHEPMFPTWLGMLGMTVEEAYEVFTTGTAAERYALANAFNELAGYDSV